MKTSADKIIKIKYLPHIGIETNKDSIRFILDGITSDWVSKDSGIIKFRMVLELLKPDISDYEKIEEAILIQRLQYLIDIDQLGGA